MADENTTRVIFRTYPKDGDVIALLIDVPANKPYITCYQHVGQHGEGSYFDIVGSTRPATSTEYAPLYQELVRIGYRLLLRQRRAIQPRQRQRYKA